MRRMMLALLAVIAVAWAVVPATASAASSGLPPDTEAAMFPDNNGTVLPAGFRIDPDQAVAIAKTAPKMVAIHRAHHPLDIRPYVWIGSHYEIYFYYHGQVIADQIVGRDGGVGPTYTGALILGIYARGHYGGIFDSPLVLVPFTLMFLLPLLLLRGASWFDRFDIAAVLTFGVSYALFDTLHLEAGVWMFYPPLVYLLVRMLIRGARSRARTGRIDCRLPTAVLAVGLLALIVARIDVTLHPFAPIDVADASLIGAYKLVHGQSLYYPSLGHGDTYGPIAYLVYAPFELIWPGGWPYLPAVRAATIAFDLLTIAALIALGVRLRSDRRDGWRLGLLLAWLWAACPFSLLGMEKSTNDGLVALIVVLVMLALGSPIKRGVLVGLGAASKFFPAILLPLVAVGRGDADEQTVRKVLAGFVVATGASIAVFLPSGGLKEFWDHTIGFQLTRTDIFSIWALHPALAPIKVALEAGAAILAVAVAFRPRGRRTPAQVAALAAALIIAVQLPALHWFYLYIVWFLPLVLIAVLGAGAPVADEPEVIDPSFPVQPGEPEHVLAAA